VCVCRTRYDAVALPTVTYPGWARASRALNTVPIAQSEMVVAAYRVMNFLLPNQIERLRVKAVLEARYKVGGFLDGVGNPPVHTSSTGIVENGSAAADVSRRTTHQTDYLFGALVLIVLELV
jgi:hypothetical protein